jgi:two-component system sensor histidine kinase CiaH
MIKTLRRRFIAASMAALVILLFILTAGILSVQAFLGRRTTDNMLAMLIEQLPRQAAGERGLPWGENAPNPPPNRGGLGRGINIREAFRAHHFSVRLGPDGSLAGTDMRFGYSASEDEAAELAGRALATGKTRGTIENYSFASLVWEGGDTSFVFLDNSPQTRALQNTAAAMAATGLVASLLMLAILLLVSRRAVEPLAQNISRQRRFVTDAGHEIKTPLAIIQANADALELNAGESKYSRNIREQVRRLDSLMHWMLALSRMDEGAGAFAFAPLCFSELAEHEILPFVERADQKQISIETDITGGITLYANRESLALLISVMMDNAVKYADEGGKIWVGLSARGSKALLEVKNSCKNFPAAPPERLFERFYRDDSARTQKGEGYGIGLSIAKSIAEMHRGKIQAFYQSDNTIRFVAELKIKQTGAGR